MSTPADEFVRTIDEFIAAVESAPRGRELFEVVPLAERLTELAKLLGHDHGPIEFDNDEGPDGWTTFGYTTRDPWGGL